MINTFRSLSPKTLLLLIGVFYGVGLALSGLLGVATIASLTPIVLLVTIILIVLYAIDDWTKPLVITLVIIGLLGFILEVIGVKTGLIFGDYQYGTVLGPTVFAVPLLLMLLWPLTALLGVSVSLEIMRTKIPFWGAWTIGAFAVVIYDIFLEPFAMATGLWDWQDGIVPLRNYVTWFIASYVFIVLLRNISMTERRRGFVIGAMAIQIVYFFGITVIAAVQ